MRLRGWRLETPRSQKEELVTPAALKRGGGYICIYAKIVKAP